MKQLELDLSDDPSRPVFPVLPPRAGVPGCPRCEVEQGEHGLCWNHQNEDRRARERQEPRVSREEIEQDHGIIETMKRDILQAAAEGRPMPWQESEDMTPSERSDFRRRLWIAMRDTGTCIVQAAPPPEGKKRRAR